MNKQKSRPKPGVVIFYFASFSAKHFLWYRLDSCVAMTRFFILWRYLWLRTSDLSHQPQGSELSRFRPTKLGSSPWRRACGLIEIFRICYISFNSSNVITQLRGCCTVPITVDLKQAGVIRIYLTMQNVALRILMHLGFTRSYRQHQVGIVRKGNCDVSCNFLLRSLRRQWISVDRLRERCQDKECGRKKHATKE